LDTSCIILAGGKSSRLGYDKILERIGKKSLLEEIVSCISSIGKEIIIVTAQGRAFPQFSNIPKVRVVYDIYPGKGSLGGIYTGLVKSNSFYNLVLAADMPFLNQPLLKYMVKVSEGYDFILPKVNNLYEPLHAIYSKNCTEHIDYLISQDRRVIVELFDFVKVKYVEDEEVNRFDPQHLSFFNINTAEDMERARIIARGEKTDDQC
jgi:molybdopterin-guanine dinucleotide biosynthesis protein A